MNKKYIVGGLIFWVGVSGYMGLRILESYTEDAVFAALSAVPAQAAEIRYSFLSNTLALKGVEYELPDDRIMHKGTIESVEVKGFNRKCVYVRPDMPAYHADALPIVAESVTAKGIVDNIHVAQTRVEQKIDEVQIRGWHQRLGMLLDQHSQHRGEASYFEELFRCSLEGFEVGRISTTILAPDAAPVNVAVDSVSLPDGLRAPRGEEKVAPASVKISGIRFAGHQFFGGLQSLDLRDVLLPEPAALAEIFRLNRDSASEAAQFGALRDETIGKVFAVLQKNYENRIPVGRVALQGASFTRNEYPPNSGGKVAVLSVGLKSLDYALSRADKGALRNTTKLSGLKINVPYTLPGAKVISRYSPDGLTLNADGESLTSDTEFSARSHYELEGLGTLDGDISLTGDMRTLEQALLSDEESPEELDALMQNLRMRSMHLVYKDSGLVPLGVEFMSAWRFSTPEKLLATSVGMLKMFGESPERPVRELCRALAEQLSRPGEFSMTIAPEKPMNAAEAFALASANPDALPVSFRSKPGDKALTDYLRGKEHE